jgi:hypothetical protein
MAVQPFVGPWPLFQFRNPIYGRTPWTGDQPVARPLITHRTAHKHRIKAHRHHASSGFRYYDPSVGAGEDSSCFRPHGHCDRLIILKVGKIVSDEQTLLLLCL